MTTLRGLAVLLPSIVLAALLIWVSKILWNFASPIGSIVGSQLDVGHGWGTAIVLVGFSILCYLIGHTVSTVIGANARKLIESRVFDRAPGYSILRNVFAQMMGSEKSPLKSFSMVRFENAGVRISGFVVDRSKSGWCTVFIPTAPNPTSGFILHVREEKVEELNVTPSDAIEAIVGCGTGSNEYHDKIDS